MPVQRQTAEKIWKTKAQLDKPLRESLRNSETKQRKPGRAKQIQLNCTEKEAVSATNEHTSPD